jgi:hypothetical protein
MRTFYCLYCKCDVELNSTLTAAAGVMKHYWERHGDLLEKSDPDAVLARTSAALQQEADAIVRVVKE